MKTQVPDFILPSTVEFQRQVLADAISSPESLVEVLRFVHASMFDGDNRTVFQTLVEMYEKSETIDLVTLSSRIDIKTLTPLLGLTTSLSGSGAYIIDHCKALRMETARKMACLKAIEIMQAVSAKKDEGDLLKLFADGAEAVEGNVSKSETVTSVEAVNRYLESLECETQRIPTGLQTIDTATGGGFGSGQLILLAARPSVGKTALALAFARTAAGSGYPVAYFSLEMTNEELAERMLLSTGRMSKHDTLHRNWDAINNAATGIDGLPIHFNDSLSDVDSIIAEMSHLQRKGACKLAILDYLGLTDTIDPKALPVHDIATKSRRLKLAAKRFGIPILLLAQLNRNSVSESRSPQLHDLRDSGALEQDADLVLMIEKTEDENLNLWVRKHRGGRRDFAVKLRPENSYTTFVEVGLSTFH